MKSAMISSTHPSLTHQLSLLLKRSKLVNREKPLSVLERLRDETFLRYYLLESSLRGVSYTQLTKTWKEQCYYLLLLACVLVLLSLLWTRSSRNSTSVEQPLTTPTVRQIPLAKPSPFSERWGLPSQVEEKVVKVETIKVSLQRESDTGTVQQAGPLTETESVPAISSVRRPISRRASSDICTRHNRRKVVYYRGKYKYWRCVR
jgi:hypothetical protein